MKILITFPSASLGGSERAMLETIYAIKKASNIKVDVIIPKDGALIDELTKICDKIYVFPFLWWMGSRKKTLFRRGKDLLSSVKVIYKWRKLILKNKYDTTITSTLTFPQLALASYFTPAKHCWYIHEFGKEDHGFIYHINRKLYYALINHFSTRVIVNSTIVFEKFKQFLLTEKMKMIYYSVDINPTLKITKEYNTNSTFILAVIGRKARGKRQEDAIKALHILQDKGISTELLLVGSEDPEYKKELLELCEKLQLQNKVQFIAFTSDPFEYYHKADAVLVTSRLEAFGRVAIEAMKLEKPVIMSNSGSGSEIIKHQETGLLYEAGDEKDLADKIQCLYEDLETRKKIAQNGYKWAYENCNIEKHGKEFLEILNSL